MYSIIHFSFSFVVLLYPQSLLLYVIFYKIQLQLFINMIPLDSLSCECIGRISRKLTMNVQTYELLNLSNKYLMNYSI